jgi:hypothetical protein
LNTRAFDLPEDAPSTPVIAPVVPPRPHRRPDGSAGGSPHRLPLPTVPTPRTPGDVVYGIARLDASGRIADRAIMATLGWQPGDRLSLAAHTGIDLIEVRAAEHGLITLDSRAHLPVPAAARQRLRLQIGEQVLLAATPTLGVLTIHPLAMLHQALIQLRGGEPA